MTTALMQVSPYTGFIVPLQKKRNTFDATCFSVKCFTVSLSGFVIVGWTDGWIGMGFDFCVNRFFFRGFFVCVWVHFYPLKPLYVCLSVRLLIWIVDVFRFPLAYSQFYYKRDAIQLLYTVV